MSADRAQPADYDVSTREGFLQRAVDITDKRIPPRYRGAMADHPDVTAWCQRFTDNPAPLLIVGKTGTSKTYTRRSGALQLLAPPG